MRRSLTAATVASFTTLAVISPLTPAEAAAARGWSTKASFTNVKAGGTYARTSAKVTFRGWLQDLKTNGSAAALQFRTTEGSRRHTSKVYFFKAEGVPADLPYKEAYRDHFFVSDYTGHAYVRECGLTPKKKYTTECGQWQKIF
ncbi:hypothetical protein [Spirillospora sp. NPDC047279]|uniref:hypothetical protein n=1 Tax=Spirillospora sp. NPDC047279 TaxID=3155478 RepID=UPI0033D77987